jgi:hypothetical protein
MWELICHHTYAWEGLPVDHSPYNHHGQLQQTSFLADGAAAGSGAVVISQQQSRVKIPSGPAWSRLGALRIEAVVRLDGSGSYRTVVWGHDSFELYVWASGGFQLLVSAPGGGRQIPVLDSTAAFAPDGQHHVVPANRWVTLGFVHDGISSALLFLDGAVVGARHDLQAGVPGVGPLGLDIGNASIGSTALRGAVDEIRIWRRDPRALWKEFARRPIDEQTADCWGAFLERLTEILARHPECSRELLPELRAMVERQARSVAALGLEARAEYDRMGDRYRKLWRAGKIDGPEMAKLAAEWLAWCRKRRVETASAAELGELRESDCFRRLFEAAAELDCDPRFTGLLRLLAEQAAA